MEKKFRSGLQIIHTIKFVFHKIRIPGKIQNKKTQYVATLHIKQTHSSNTSIICPMSELIEILINDDGVEYYVTCRYVRE